ncbi:MAG: hypothetical protein PHT54_00895 [Candidatus Nanoarchaeia archaeon]|nr:hypothetical protein [Candidatus Nanoarchaeia archaeon]
MAHYKQLCAICKKNMVLMSFRKKFPICVDCELKQIDGEIENPKFKKLFDIPVKFYRENDFLRDIKKKYLMYGFLTEKQIAAFKKTVKEMQKDLKKG